MSWNRIVTFLCSAAWLGWFSYVRGGDLPLLKLRLDLDVPDCTAFDDIAVGRAYCTAFAEEANFADGTYDCLTRETGCVADSRRKLLWASFSRRSLASNRADVVLGGTFDGLGQEGVEEAASAILANGTRFGRVKENAVEILEREGAFDAALRLDEAVIRNGTATVDDDVIRECDVDLDCEQNSQTPICESGFCVACNTTFEKLPTLQGNCAASRKCLPDGSCFQQQVVTASQTTSSQIQLEWECPGGCPTFQFELQCFADALQECQLDASSAGTPQSVQIGDLNGTVTRLNPTTDYTCFVVGNETTNGGIVCSPPTESITTNCEGGEELPSEQGTCPDNFFCRVVDDEATCVRDQCDEDVDCAGDFPICRIESSPMLCIECAEQETPAVAGNCGEGRFCRASGMCSVDQCSDSIECGESFVCFDSTCVECAVAADCDVDRTRPVCVGNNTCVACTVQFPPEEGEGGCEPGLFCRTDGSCQPTQCMTNTDCGESLICQNSVCVMSVAPGEPSLPSPTVNARSVSLSWSDGREGVPLELYGLQCLEQVEACQPSAIESYSVQRGTEFGVKGGLQSGAEYTCYVIANNTAGANCSEPIAVLTLTPSESRTLEIQDPVDFGFAVAVSADGSLAVVSDPGVNDNRGAVYLLEFNATTASWEEQRIWLGDQAGSRFGHSVSINEEGTIILAGAPEERQVGIVQRSSGSDWPMNATFISKPNVDGFGTSVSASGRKAVVGSPSLDSEDPGNVFVLDFTSGHTAAEERQLSCPNNSSSCGAAVSIKGDHFVVSEPEKGKVYLYDLEGVPDEPPLETFDKPGSSTFGESLALELSTFTDTASSFVLLVGAPSDGVAEGIVYFFEESDQGTWMEGPSFQPTGASAEFGRSVALQPLSVATQWAVGDPTFILTSGGAYFVGVLSDGSLVSISEPQTLTDESHVGRGIALGGSQIVVGSSLTRSLSSQISSQQVETVDISTEFTNAAVPGSPNNLQADRRAENIALFWTVGLEGTPEEYYTVKCVGNWTENCLAPASGLQINNIARGTAFANITGLQPGQPYSCFVIANNIAADFCQVQSSINVTTARQPEAPTNLSLIVLGSTFARVSFVAGTPQGIPAERFFAKCVSPGGGCFASAVGTINSVANGGRDAIVEDLPEDGAVDCFVIASNIVARFNPDTGIGGICSEGLTFTTLLAPGRPVNPSLSSRTNQSVELEWEDGSEGKPTETFTLRSVLPGGTCSSSSQGFPPADPIARGVRLGSVSGLSSGNTFVSFVIARNNVTSSRGVCSQSVTATTTRLPLAPNSVGIQDIEERSVVLVWTDGSIPGVPAERFTVKCGELNAVCENATVGTGENVGRGIGEGIITGLTPNQEYTCFVSARSNGGPEVCSNGVSVRTDASFCFPSTLPAVQGSCEGDEFCRIDGTCSTQQCESIANCGGTAPICNNDDLCAGCNSTTVGTQGECDSGLFCSDSGACLPARPPDSASGLTLVQRNTSDITIEWTPGTEGFPEETYEVKCVVDMEEAGCLSPSQGTSAENLPRSLSPNATVTFLSPGVEYLCFVIGNNAATGAAKVCSNSLSVQTLRPPPRPTNVGIAEVTETAVALEWTEGPPGVPIEQYEVRCQEAGTACQESGSQGISATGIGRGAREGTVSSLVRNTDYICFVVAYSSNEEPECSAGVNVRTERQQCNPSNTPPVQGSCPDDEFCIGGLCFSTQCRTSGDCGGNRPICEEGQCVACSPSNVPAIMGNCANNVPDTFCSADGACLPPTPAGPPGGIETLARTPSSVNVSWSYGTEAFPQEKYTLKCVIPGEDCAADAQGLAESDMPRGPGVGGRGSVTGLAPGTDYDCFVLAVSPAEQNETNAVCSSPLLVQTFQPPSPPENVALLSSSLTSVEIGWDDGPEPGIPLETFTVRCYEGTEGDCRAPNPSGEVQGISPGVGTAEVTGLSALTEYTCYVVAVNSAAPEGVCADGVIVSTDECESDVDCDILFYRRSFCLIRQAPLPNICVECLDDADCQIGEVCTDNRCF